MVKDGNSWAEQGELLLQRHDGLFVGAEVIVQTNPGDLTIDFDRHRVLRDGQEIRLTPKEFELLALLARHPNRVLTHHTLLTSIWGAHAATQSEYLWVLFGRLRKKLEADAAHPRYLVSEPWVGYRFVLDTD